MVTKKAARISGITLMILHCTVNYFVLEINIVFCYQKKPYQRKIIVSSCLKAAESDIAPQTTIKSQVTVSLLPLQTNTTVK